MLKTTKHSLLLLLYLYRVKLFLPLSDVYVRSFLYLLYTLIKLYYTHTQKRERQRQKKRRHLSNHLYKPCLNKNWQKVSYKSYNGTEVTQRFELFNSLLKVTKVSGHKFHACQKGSSIIL